MEWIVETEQSAPLTRQLLMLWKQGQLRERARADASSGETSS
jgi:hypothetical protein